MIDHVPKRDGARISTLAAGKSIHNTCSMLFVFFKETGNKVPGADNNNV